MHVNLSWYGTLLDNQKKPSQIDSCHAIRFLQSAVKLHAAFIEIIINVILRDSCATISIRYWNVLIVVSSDKIELSKSCIF